MYTNPRSVGTLGRCSPSPVGSNYSFQSGNQGGRHRPGSVTSTSRQQNLRIPVFGNQGQPHGMQHQQFQMTAPGAQYLQNRNQNQQLVNAGINRARSHPMVPHQYQQQSQHQLAQPQQSQQIVAPAGMKTSISTAGIPPEVEANPNVQYVRMNWEDILGGKGGLQGLQVSMTPGNGDPKANRQIRIGMGGAEQPKDGSTPLRIVSFQPVENYSGLKDPTPLQPGQPKFTVVTGSGRQEPNHQQQQKSQTYQQGWPNNFYSNGRR